MNMHEHSTGCMLAAFNLIPQSSNKFECHGGLQHDPQNFYFLDFYLSGDLNLILGYWQGGGKRAYHHTAPINTLYALHEALVILQEEGIENSWARHRRNHEVLRAGIEAMGLEFVVPEGERLPQLNAVSVPDGVDEAAVRAALLDEYNLEIGAGLGAMAGKIWRIGLMGYASNPTNVLFCLGALDAVLTGMRAPIKSGVAVDAARRALTEAA